MDSAAKASVSAREAAPSDQVRIVPMLGAAAEPWSCVRLTVS